MYKEVNVSLPGQGCMPTALNVYASVNICSQYYSIDKHKTKSYSKDGSFKKKKLLQAGHVAHLDTDTANSADSVQQHSPGSGILQQ